MTAHPEDYAAIEGASAPTFTRDGRTLLFLRGSGLAQVCALALDSGDQRQLTRHDEKVALLRRCPLDDSIIYGIDRGGDERQQLWLLDASEIDPAPRPLTQNAAAIHDWGGWAPDGSQFAYAANDRDEANFDVTVQDMASGQRRYVFQGQGIVSVSGFRPDGTALGPAARPWLRRHVAAAAGPRVRRGTAVPAVARLQLPIGALGLRRALAAGPDRPW